MDFYFYIIYSESIDKYYIGYTINCSQRLVSHNSNHKGFTGNSNDWKYVYQEAFQTKREAYAREREVKKWKSRKKVEILISKKT